MTDHPFPPLEVDGLIEFVTGLAGALVRPSPCRMRMSTPIHPRQFTLSCAAARLAAADWPRPLRCFWSSLVSGFARLHLLAACPGAAPWTTCRMFPHR